MSAFDREKAREVLLWPGDPSLEATLDALAGCVTDEPQTIDRDEAIAAAERAVHRPLLGDLDDDCDLRVAVVATDAVLALLRPDPRIAKLKARVAKWDERYETHYELINDVCAILRGEA
ncbi:MAG: hypothetical protein ABWZ77_05155 [Naasia sp.]